MPLTRRSLLLSALASSALAAIGNLPAFAQDIRKLRIGFGSKSVTGQALNTMGGEAMGYAKSLGFSIDAQHLGAMTSVMVGLDRGTIDIGAMSPSFNLPLYAKGEMPPIIAFYEYTYPYKWDLVVKPDSPIKDYAGLVGKKIGVSNLGTTDYPVTRAVMKNNGIDPDSASWIAVGDGVTAGVALDRGQIDALAYYDVGFAMAENAGIALRYLPRPSKVPMIGGLYMGASRDYLKTNRANCVAYGKSMAMASVFILANPDAAVSIFLDRYPEVAPRGVSKAEAIKQTVQSIARRSQLYAPPYPGGKIGQIYESEWREEADFLALKIADVKPLFTNELIDDIHDFDHDKLAALAKAYKI